MQYFIDIDMTVADNNHRATWLTNQDISNAARWDRFYAPTLVRVDTLIPQAAVLDRLLGDDRHEVIFVTARPEKIRQDTLDWLEKAFTNFNEEQHKVIMKPNNNKGPSAPWKVEEVKKLATDGNFTFIDDNRSNREYMAKAFPNARILEPLAGWEQIIGELENTVGSEDTSEINADELIDASVDSSADQEDYSDMD